MPEIWHRACHHIFIFQNSDVRFVYLENFGRLYIESKTLGESIRPGFKTFRNQSRKVHGEQLSVPPHGKRSAIAGLEMHHISPRFVHVKDYESRSQRGVAAEPYLATCCEPTELVAVFGGHQKSRSEKVIFCSDFAQQPVI